MLELASLVYAAAGLAVFAAALLPRLLVRAPISMPMIFLGTGILLFTLMPELPTPDPVEHGDVTVHLTEVCVIISLMGAGLALDRPLSRHGWGTTWRLLGIAMPLCLVGFALLGGWLLGLGVAGAVLLAAVLAPTDPVLASEVQVGAPAEAEEDLHGEDEVRFGLTSEAGLNDGLAFPFVYLAIVLSLVGIAPDQWLLGFLGIDLAWRIAVGCLLGWLVGRGLRRVFFQARKQEARLAESSEGFVALAAIFLTYGVTEAVEGYGFIAVFVCAVTIRAGQQTHEFHGVLHSYIEQLERLLTVVVLVLLGGAVARGLLTGTTWVEVLVTALILLVVRPLAGWIGLAGGKTGRSERAVLAFYGVRGIGSLYYLSYALTKGDFTAETDVLWRIVGLVIVGSILVHGTTAGPVMHVLDRARERRAEAHGDADDAASTAV